MSFFEDIGRANLLGQVGQAVSNMGAMQDMQAKEQAIKTDAMKQEALKYELDKKRQEEAVRKTTRPLSSIMPNWKEYPEETAIFKDLVKSAGHKWDETPSEIYINGDTVDYIQKAKKDKDELKGIVVSARLENLDGKVKQASDLLDQEKEKGKGPDDKSYQDALLKFNTLTTQYAKVYDEANKLDAYYKKETFKTNEMIRAKKSELEEAARYRAEVKAQSPYGQWAADNKLDPTKPETKQAFINFTREMEDVKKKETQKSGQEKGITSSGWAVFFDPNDNMLKASKAGPSGEPVIEPFNKAKHGQPMQNAMPFSVVINQQKEQREGQGSFPSWSQAEKEQAFLTDAITGKMPQFAFRDKSSRNTYNQEKTRWQIAKGLTPQVVARMQADYKAGDVSLKNMSKQEAPMAAFVGNINKQISKIEQLYQSGDRTGIRLVDLPIRELRLRAKGSGDEAVKASYLLEVSNEIGKLSSGASASVQQLSDSAKEDWKRVHDPNLSLKEITKVLNATREQANMRISSWREAKEDVRTALKDIGVQDLNPSASEVVPRKPGETISEYLKRTSK